MIVEREGIMNERRKLENKERKEINERSKKDRMKYVIRKRTEEVSK